MALSIENEIPWVYYKFCYIKQTHAWWFWSPDLVDKQLSSSTNLPWMLALFRFSW